LPDSGHQHEWMEQNDPREAMAQFVCALRSASRTVLSLSLGDGAYHLVRLLRGGGADQGGDRVMDEEVAPDLPSHHVRGLGAQDLPRSAQERLDLLGATWQLTRTSKNGGAVDPTSLSTFEPNVISWLEPHLVQTYLAINRAAPTADIGVVGYPYIFPRNATKFCNSGSIAGTVALLSANAQNMLNGFANDLDNVISQAVQETQADGVDIQFVNPQSAFTGHDICGSSSWFLRWRCWRTGRGATTRTRRVSRHWPTSWTNAWRARFPAVSPDGGNSKPKRTDTGIMGKCVR
jgi:hypothetical protein